MRRLPSLPALRIFEVAARSGSFTGAATALGLTPSAISHQIQALETYFGQKLFFRHGGRVLLTPQGTLLSDRLTTAFTIMEEACADLGRAEAAGRLAVHCAPSFASKWLGPRLPAFMRRHFPLTLRLSSGADAVDLSRREDLDIVISYGAAVACPGITVECLGIEDVVALCTPQMAARCDLRDPAIAPLLIDSSINPVGWPAWFERNGLAVPPPVRRPSFDRGALAVAAAADGLGIALESRWFALDELASGTLVEPGGGMYRPVQRALHYLSCREAQTSAPQIVAFRSWLSEAIALEGVRCA